MSKHFLMVEVEVRDDEYELTRTLQRAQEAIQGVFEHGWLTVTEASVWSVDDLRTTIREALNSGNELAALRDASREFSIEYDEDVDRYRFAEAPIVTVEFEQKQRELALFLFNMCNGQHDSLEAIAADPSYGQQYVTNYMADADEVIRSNPHLLGLASVEAMKLEKEEK